MRSDEDLEGMWSADEDFYRLGGSYDAESGIGLSGDLVPKQPKMVEMLIVRPPGLQLVKRIVLRDPQQIDRLIDDVNRLRRPEANFRVGVFIDAEKIWLRFTYGDGSEVVVSVARRSGRSFATIQTTATRLTDEEFLRTLDTLIGEAEQDT